MLWWFPQNGRNEQYRIRGRLILVGSQGRRIANDCQLIEERDWFLARARKEQWQQMSPAAQDSFVTLQIPGAALGVISSTIMDGSVAAAASVVDNNNGIDPEEPPDNFLLLLLVPNRCDYLRLGANMHRQIDTLLVKANDEDDDDDDNNIYASRKWSSVPVNP